MAERLSIRTGVPREARGSDRRAGIGAHGAAANRHARGIRLTHASARRLRQLRVETEVEHETAPPEPSPPTDEAANRAWRGQSWMG